MTETETVLVALDAGVLTLTLNRPDKLNAFNEAMHLALRAGLRARGRGRRGAGGAADRRRPRLLRRAGPRRPRPAQGRRGARPRRDARDLLQPDAPADPRAREAGRLRGERRRRRGRAPTSRFACDIVLAARSAKFIQAFAKIGLVPDAGGSWSLPRILGEPRAKALALLAEPLDAETAADWGLIWKAVDDAALLDEARAIAVRLAAGPTRGPRPDQAGDPGGGGQQPRRPARPRARPAARGRAHRGLCGGRRRLPREAQAGVHRPMTTAATALSPQGLPRPAPTRCGRTTRPRSGSAWDRAHRPRRGDAHDGGHRLHDQRPRPRPRRLRLRARRQRLRLRLQRLQPAHRRPSGGDHLRRAGPARRPADRGRPRGAIAAGATASTTCTSRTTGASRSRSSAATRAP